MFRQRGVAALQTAILEQAATLVRFGGCMAYATCSLLDAENHARIKAFLARHSDLSKGLTRRFTPLEGSDGFFVAQLAKVE